MSNGKPEYCLTCPLYDAPGPVRGSGSCTNKTFILGEAPGHDEVTYTKRPFTGGSGKLLRAVASAVGLRVENSFVSNVVRCRPTAISPASGKVIDRPPTKEEIEHCAPFLREELLAAKPSLVLLLGGTALYAIKDTNEISKHRGVPFTAGGYKVLATFHPAALMRQQAMFPAFYTDLKKAVEEAKNPNLVVHDVRYKRIGDATVDGPALVESALRSGFVCFDIETIGVGGTYKGALDPNVGQVVCYGLGTEPYTATCFAWSDRTRSLLAQLFLDSRIEKIGQNSEGFDIPFLEGKGLPEPVGRTFDTLVAFHLVNSDMKKDLATIASFYTDMPYWKHEAKTGDLFLYNCKDVDATTRSALGLKKELALLGMEDLYWKIVQPVQKVIRRMTRRGLRKDEYEGAKLAIGFRSLADEKEQMVQSALGYTFNINSPKQMIDLCYNKLGLPKQYTKRADGSFGLTCNDEAMDTLAQTTNDPIFKVINAVRTWRKWASTYCEVESDDKGFIHPKFSTAKAANGRFSSFDPNAQNVPWDLRHLWLPDDEDHVLISSDWNQVEWRNAICDSGDQSGLEILASGIDTHRAVAADTMGVQLNEVDDDLRHAAKFIVYGLLYGRGADDIAVQLQKPVSWVNSFIFKFFSRFSGIKKRRDMMENFVANNNFLRNPWGRRRWWFVRGKAPEIFNFLPSSTAADMMYQVLPVLEEQLPAGASLRLTVHDEVVVCSHKDVALQAAICVKDVMNRTWPDVVNASLYPERVRSVFKAGWTIPADINFGTNWKECKPKGSESKARQKELRSLLNIPDNV